MINARKELICPVRLAAGPVFLTEPRDGRRSDQGREAGDEANP